MPIKIFIFSYYILNFNDFDNEAVYQKSEH